MILLTRLILEMPKKINTNYKLNASFAERHGYMNYYYVDVLGSLYWGSYWDNNPFKEFNFEFFINDGDKEDEEKFERLKQDLNILSIPFKAQIIDPGPGFAFITVNIEYINFI